MSYPQPDERIIGEWQAITDVLVENLAVDAALLRREGGGSLEVLAAAPDSAPFKVGDRAPSDGSHFCDVLLSGREAPGELLEVLDASSDMRWKETADAAAGFPGYVGMALCWPDGEAYGTLSVLRREAFSSDELSRASRLLQCLGNGAMAQLGLLVKREEGHYEATHDALTGLPNRQLFNELAGMQMQLAQRNDSTLWVVLWSIDGFAEQAEKLGRDAVNNMLGRVSERARSCIRQSDVLARLGDNQFAFMLAGANEFVANAVTDRLRRNLNSLDAWPDHGSGVVTASCGLSPYAPKEELDDWLARARGALDDASNAGGGVTMVRE